MKKIIKIKIKNQREKRKGRGTTNLALFLALRNRAKLVADKAAFASPVLTSVD